MKKYEDIKRELESKLRAEEVQKEADSLSVSRHTELLRREFARRLESDEENVLLTLLERRVLQNVPVPNRIIHCAFKLDFLIKTEGLGAQVLPVLARQTLQLVDDKAFMGNYLEDKGFWVSDEKAFDQFYRRLSKQILKK